MSRLTKCTAETTQIFQQFSQSCKSFEDSFDTMLVNYRQVEQVLRSVDIDNSHEAQNWYDLISEVEKLVNKIRNFDALALTLNSEEMFELVNKE